MLILSSVIVLCCVFFNKISDKFGLPALLAFILLGMLFGSDGLFKIEFDNYKFAEEICSVGLVFIIFYGGFGTKWSEAKKVAHKLVTRIVNAYDKYDKERAEAREAQKAEKDNSK